LPVCAGEGAGVLAVLVVLGCAVVLGFAVAVAVRLSVIPLLCKQHPLCTMGESR